MAMGRSQPATQVNYTEIGFKKIRLPKEAWDPLIEYYNANKEGQQIEAWGRGNTYVNNWVNPTMMVSFENKKFAGGQELKALLWRICKPIIEEWTGKEVRKANYLIEKILRDDTRKRNCSAK
jgi:prolyl 4-hydroxylase